VTLPLNFQLKSMALTNPWGRADCMGGGRKQFTSMWGFGRIVADGRLPEWQKIKAHYGHTLDVGRYRCLCPELPPAMPPEEGVVYQRLWLWKNFCGADCHNNEAIAQSGST